MNRMLRYITMTILLLTMGLLTACGGKQSKETVSMYDLQKAMLAADDTLPEMLSVNSSSDDAQSLFTYLSDLDYGKVDSYFLAYSSEGLADEIAVIALKDEADVNEAEKFLHDHVDSRVKLYENYAANQVPRAEAATIFCKDQYVVLIISDKAQEVKAAFLDEIG